MISDLAERLRRMRAEDQGYHLERAAVESMDDGLRWLRDWHTTDGVYTWMGASDAERRRALKHWRWIRWSFAREWRERGGRHV